MRRTQQNFFAGTGAIKDQALVTQGLDRGQVGIMPLMLPDDVPVPVQSELVEGEQDVIRGAGNNARGIQVLHAQQPPAPCLTRQTIAANRRDQRTEMQGSGRTWGKTTYNLFDRHAEEFPGLTPSNLGRFNEDIMTLATTAVNKRHQNGPSGYGRQHPGQD